MKILAVADAESPALWEHFDKSRLTGIDLIISCGDLAPEYLSFLATFTHAPVLFVHGNHDENYEQTPPDGCISIEDQIYVFQGIRILGLGGSMRYRDGKYQYTERQMKARIRRLWLTITCHRGFDILVTHAPAYQLGDGRDLPHQGFQAFRELLEKYEPRIYLYGHMHLNYSCRQKRFDQYQGTYIINAYERCVFDYEDENLSAHLK